MASLSDVPAFEVSGDTFDWQGVVDYLKARDRLGFLEDALDHRLALAGARAAGIAIADEDLQRAADAFREARGLFEAAATMAWLEARGLTVDQFEKLVEEELLLERLKDRVVAGRIESFFAENKVRFDAAELSHILVADEGTARELHAQVVEDGADLAGLARLHSTDRRTGPAGGYLGALRRKQVPAPLEAAVFGAKAGEVVGPLRSEDGWHLVRVHAVRRATLDEDTRATIREVLFREWLDAERRRTRARVVRP